MLILTHLNHHCNMSVPLSLKYCNDPMSPEKIALHEPTAVKRDKNQGTSGEPV